MKRTVVMNLRDMQLPIQLQPEQEQAFNADQLHQYILKSFFEHLQTASNVKKSIEIKETTVLPDGVIFDRDIYAGRIVRTIHNELGIITNFRTTPRTDDDEKPVTVILPGHRIWYYDVKELFKTDAQFREARCIRLAFSRNEDLWHEGDTGYIKTKKGNHVPIIVGTSSRGQVNIYEVSSEDKPSRCWQIPYIKTRQYIKEFLTEEEQGLYMEPEELIEFYRLIAEKTTKQGLTRAEQLTLLSNEQFVKQPQLYCNAKGDLKRFINRCKAIRTELVERLESQGVNYKF